jgi:hypothetical protein
VHIFLPLALSCVLLELLLALGGDPLLLENFHLFRQVSFDGAEKVFVHDAFRRLQCLEGREDKHCELKVDVGPVAASSHRFRFKNRKK